MSIATLSLGEIATEIVSGIACGKANAIADGVLHLRPFSVTPDGSLSISDAPRIPANLIPNGRLGFRVGDILFNNTNSVELVGKSAVLSAPLEASFSNHMTRVRVDATKADSRFVQAFLRHLYHRRFFEGRATRWVGQAAFGPAQLKAIEVPLPPLDEQRRIVSLLDRAAEIRRRAEAARTKARAIIPALFLDMFGDPATNPKGWPHLPFGQITNEFRYGTNQKCHDEAKDGSVPVLRIPNVIGGQIDWSDIKHAALPAKEREKTRLRIGDLLFVRTNGNPDYIGRCAYFDAQTDVSYASYLIRARLADSISPIFATHHFNHPRFRPLMLRMGKTTAGNYNLSVEGLSALPVMVPPFPLQTAFTEKAQRLAATARALDSATAKAEAMAVGLSAEVFAASPTKGNGHAGAQTGQ